MPHHARGAGRSNVPVAKSGANHVNKMAFPLPDRVPKAVSPVGSLSGFGCTIAGTGSALGSRVVTARETEERLGMPRGWVVDRTGVAERRMATDAERTSTLGLAAARQALDVAGLQAQDIDLVICATMTAEMSCPATSQRIAAELGAA